MATRIDTIEDLMRVLDTNPEWLEAVRSRLLTRELLAMPQTLADLAETTNRRFGAVDSRFEAMDRRFDAMDRRLQRLEDRTAILVGAHARNEALREIVLLVSEMGMTKMRRLWSLEDVHALVQAGDTTGIPANELRSFRRADAIVEAEDGEGRTCYIAAEVSFTVNGRDTSRAIRNAGYMTRFTGEQAYPAVIGVRIDEQIRETLASDDLYWYRLDPQTLEVE